MNINKLFKFKKSLAYGKVFHVIHRESCRWVMNVHYVEAGPLDDSPSYWQAAAPAWPGASHDSTFNAATRAAAVQGLLKRLARYKLDGPVLRASYGGSREYVRRHFGDTK